MTDTQRLLWPTVAVPLCLGVALVVLATGCPPTTGTADAGPQIPPPEAFCPNAPGCESATGELLAGAAKRTFTPTAFETANPAYLKNDRPDFCEPDKPSVGATSCGELDIDHLFDDCGRDGICPGANDYVAEDADGTERDGDTTDYFNDCGSDRICPGDADYVAPDADGTEGDGVFQGLWIAGYGNSRPAMGVKDDLWARAIVLQTGDVTVALVTVDAVGLFYDEVKRIRELVEAERPGAFDYITVQATHTHEAPDTMGQWGLESPFTGLPVGTGRNADVMGALRNAATDAIVEAYDALTPATMHMGQVNTRVDGYLRDGRDPQIFNDVLTATRVEATADNSVIASIVHWSNHPEILDSRNNYISSDFVHAVREHMENGLDETATSPARAGLGGVAIYQQGTVGGLMGPNGFEFTGRDGTVYENRMKTWARCDAYGERLAEQAFIALDDAEPLDTDDGLAFAVETYRAPVNNVIFQVGLPIWFDREVFEYDATQATTPENTPNLETQVAFIRLGGLSWLTAPGEMFPESFVGFGTEWSYGRPLVDPENELPPDLDAAPTTSLAERIGGTYPLIFGLGNDETGYLVPTYDFILHPEAPYLEDGPGDRYEETNSIGPEAAPRLMAAYDILFAHMDDASQK